MISLLAAAAATADTGPSTWQTLVTTVVSASVVAALVTGGINLWLARLHRLEAQRTRIGEELAEAFKACAEYKEFPYAIRRRDHQRPAEERVRLSEAVRAVQARMSYYSAWTETLDVSVGKCYAELVKTTRTIAGGAMREAWLAPAIDRDDQMNIPPEVVDLSGIKSAETSFMTAADSYVNCLGRWRRH